MRTIFTNPRVVSSNEFFVRIRASQGDLPVNIDIESAAIDSRAGRVLCVNKRWQVAAANLRLLVSVAECRYIQGASSEGVTLGGPVRRVVLHETDLRKAPISFGEQRDTLCDTP
jgi:hypothetical protein